MIGYYHPAKFWLSIFLIAFGIISIKWGGDILSIVGLHSLIVGIWGYKKYRVWCRVL